MTYLLVVLYLVALAALAQGLCRDEQSSFRVHSDACASQAPLEEGARSALVRGSRQLDASTPGLLQHVYCVLVRCKAIGKDGKPLKADHLVNTKKCGELAGNTPEEIAWNLYRCGHYKKSALN